MSEPKAIIKTTLDVLKLTKDGTFTLVIEGQEITSMDRGVLQVAETTKKVVWRTDKQGIRQLIQTLQDVL